jgi:hypothetical protein
LLHTWKGILYFTVSERKSIQLARRPTSSFVFSRGTAMFKENKKEEKCKKGGRTKKKMIVSIHFK